MVTTTTDLRSLVEEVGGNQVEATSLVPSAVDAEEYQPKPQDIARLKDARLLVRVGLDFDLWIDKLLTKAGNARLMRGAEGYVDASAAIAVLDVRGVSLGGPAGLRTAAAIRYWPDPRQVSRPYPPRLASTGTRKKPIDLQPRRLDAKPANGTR